MFRIAWFIAGCVAGYIASGYVEGLVKGMSNSNIFDSPQGEKT